MITKQSLPEVSKEEEMWDKDITRTFAIAVIRTKTNYIRGTCLALSAETLLVKGVKIKPVLLPQNITHIS